MTFDDIELIEIQYTSDNFYIEKKHVKSSHTKHYTIEVLSHGNFVQFTSSKDSIHTEITL